MFEKRSKNRRIAALFAAMCLISGIAQPASACDPLGCLLGNKDQDLLAIVTVTAVQGKIATVIPRHIYKQRAYQPQETFTIDFNRGTPWHPIQPATGTHYFVSLACTNSTACVPKWGTWEVDGPDYQTARLTEKITYSDDAAIQYFINGRGSDFYFANNKAFARTPDGDVEIFPLTPEEITSPSPLTSDIRQSLFHTVAPNIIIILALLALSISHARKERRT